MSTLLETRLRAAQEYLQIRHGQISCQLGEYVHTFTTPERQLDALDEVMRTLGFVWDGEQYTPIPPVPTDWLEHTP